MQADEQYVMDNNCSLIYGAVTCEMGPKPYPNKESSDQPAFPRSPTIKTFNIATQNSKEPGPGRLAPVSSD